MNYRNVAINRNIARTVIKGGGGMYPLIIPAEESKGLGLMNPSVLVDDGELIINLRNVNYTLYHAEHLQYFNNRYGPLVYLNPENDLHLRTTNFLLHLNRDLSIRSYSRIDTSKHDIDPVWDFVGLEDIRLVRWDGKLYGCGVRRDVKPNGEGRMELSELEYKGSGLEEISRHRIAPPNDPNSYCEKNWMPVLDQEYTFVKWTNPTEVVKVNPKSNTSKTIHLNNYTMDGMPDLRGGSQVIPFRDHYLCIVHDCDLFGNKLKQKDATYMHRWVVWDRAWNMVHISEPWSFMDAEIEFCCGLAEYHGDLLVTFGFQDNAAYLLRIPEHIIAEIIEADIRPFDWGPIDPDMIFLIQKEIVQMHCYDKHQKIGKDDLVVDLGANVGSFARYASPKAASVICVEPSKILFPLLEKNVGGYSNVELINVALGAETKQGVRARKDDAIYLQRTGTYDVLDFHTFTDTHRIHGIDFLKVDIEGAEYDIFTVENMAWFESCVKFATIEFHIKGIVDGVKKFKQFRDLYLTDHFKWRVEDTMQVDIRDKIFDDSYLQSIDDDELFIQLMVHIWF